MHFLGLMILTVAKILRLLINLYTLIVAVSVLISWVHADPYNPLVRFLNQLTNPVFRFVRRFLPKVSFRGGLDLSPILVFIFLIALDTLLVGLLFDLAGQLLWEPLKTAHLLRYPLHPTPCGVQEVRLSRWFAGALHLGNF